MSDEKVQTAEVKAVEEVKVEAVVSPEDIKRAGIKDAVVDSDTVAIEKEKEVTEPEKVVVPSFFVDTTERRRIEIDFLSTKDTGKIVSISRAGMGIDFKEFPFLSYKREWFEFTVPSYEDMSSYRSRCAQWRKEANQMLVDRLQLRHFFLVWHLKDWSLMDKEGKKVELIFDKDGSLSAESISILLSAQATILDVVLTSYEKDILLI